jgi:hypothetical protein
MVTDEIAVTDVCNATSDSAEIHIGTVMIDSGYSILPRTAV